MSAAGMDSGLDFRALHLTLRLAGLTTLLLLLLATPMAWWLASGRGWLRRAVQAAVALPLVLPPTALGLYLLQGLGPTTPSGRLLIRAFGHPLAFSFEGLLLGSMIYSLPFAVQPLVAGFRSVDPQMVELTRSLGASAIEAFRRVVLPLSRGSFLTAAVLVFCHTVGEFGVVLMLGGDIEGSTRTLSIALYDRAQEGNYRAANQIALLLLLLSFAGLLVVYLTSEGAADAAIVAGQRRWRRLQ